MHRRFALFTLALFVPLVLIAQATAPTIARRSENANRIGLYEKYEALLEPGNATYLNPYNPEEIDVRALFTSPGGRQWTIYGFYDHYQNRDQWKVRFAPNEAGTWSYTLSVTTPAGRGVSEVYTFEAVASAHHGWLHLATGNPHYMTYDDGTPFYGIAIFWPWGIAESGLNTLKGLGCNWVGLWNITYDTGNTLIESMSSGLGRYDQNKCKRIDDILEWMEKRDMALSLSIWPHDLFCKSLSGWAQRWNDNPYNQLCDVVEIYENETAWGYMEKQYRYIIARWGYSRALGPWEIINEITGTDAWAAGRTAGAEEWTRKSYAFLRAHDPFDRPVTASQHGGHFWATGYGIFDLPNMHLYETDGGTARFASNPVRSSAWAYHDAARRMWEGFAKPAILGEAGGGSNKNFGGYAPGSAEYTRMFHNALWTSWSSGLAASPMWWSWNTHQSDVRFQEQLKAFSRVAPGIDYARRPFRPAEVSVAGADAFAMGDGEMAFGWVREEWGRDLSARSLQINGLSDSVYNVEYYDTWKGMVIASHVSPAVAGQLVDELPQMSASIPDLAFIIRPAATGTLPFRLVLMAAPRRLYSDGESRAEVRCLIFDEQGRFCSGAANNLTFALNGLGHLVSPAVIEAEKGLAMVVVQSDSAGSGETQIMVSSPGLVGDTLSIIMSDLQWVDDFESYDQANPVGNFWKTTTGTFAALMLESRPGMAGGQCLRVDYGIGSGKPPYAGFIYTLPAALKGAKFLRLYLHGDGSGRGLAVRINRTSSSYWQYEMTLASSEERMVELPLSAFVASDGSSPLDLTRALSLSFHILKGSGGDGSGTIALDDILFANSATSGVTVEGEPILPASLQLLQNWPNPFNAATEISFILPRRARPELAVYNVQGRRVATLASGERPAGRHCLLWQAVGMPSGAYFLVLEAGGERAVLKCLLLR